MKTQIFGLNSNASTNMPLIEYLNNSAYDELVEIDLMENRYRNLYHVEGKYYTPMLDTSYSSLFWYSVENMVHPEDKQVYLDLMNPNTLLKRLENAEMPGVLSEQFRYKLVDGAWRWVEQCVIAGERHGLPDGIVRCYVFDVQNQKDREMGAISSAYYSTLESRDDKTRLLVDNAFFTKARKLLESGEAEGWNMLAIDIEHFKLFNDWYGRDAGDILLARIGLSLSHLEEERGCLAGYLGLDDFALLAPSGRGIVGRLYEDICDLITAHGASIGFQPAFGVCRVEEGLSAFDLYDRAAYASDVAKEHINDRIRIFEPYMFEETDEEYRILTEFHTALSNGEICFYLQPQCRASNGKIVGVECLARWIKPDGTMIPPVKFIPVLEKHGFVTDLDCYLWEQVCIRLKAWIDAGHSPVPISINVSQVDIDMIDVVEYLELLMRTYGLPSSLIKVELTESAYTDNTEEVTRTAERLRERGFMVMMDDFGSGYSSLNMLRNLSVDVLKLDAFFLHMSEEDVRKGIRILESIVNMAKTMALPIVAEGVETQEQVEFLSGMGCRYMQGFHFYRPMPPDEVEKLLDDGELVDKQGFISVPNEEFRIREFLDRNVYSDSMLNSILGSVALYYWHGDDVDIVRFNEQFYEAVGISRFEERLKSIQRFMPDEERPKLYQLLKTAEADPLNGASGVAGFYTTEDEVLQFYLRFFFLERKENGKLFYASARNITEQMELKEQMELISRYSSDSIALVYRHGDRWDCQVVVHGLEDVMGLTKEQFQAELDDGSFYNRVDEASVKRLRDLARHSEKAGEGFTFPIAMENANGESVNLHLRSNYVEGNVSGVTFVLTFR